MELLFLLSPVSWRTGILEYRFVHRSAPESYCFLLYQSLFCEIGIMLMILSFGTSEFCRYQGFRQNIKSAFILSNRYRSTTRRYIELFEHQIHHFLGKL